MKSCLAVLMILLCHTAAPAADDLPKTEAFGGVSVLSVDRVQGMGWQGAAQRNITGNLGIVADIGGHYKFGVSAYQFLFGPRFSARSSRKTAFVHALFGAARLHGFEESLNGFALGIGGGLDVNATDRFSIRVFQLDWIPVRMEGRRQTRNARAGFGVVFKH